MLHLEVSRRNFNRVNSRTHSLAEVLKNEGYKLVYEMTTVASAEFVSRGQRPIAVLHNEMEYPFDKVRLLPESYEKRFQKRCNSFAEKARRAKEAKYQRLV